MADLIGHVRAVMVSEVLSCVRICEVEKKTYIIMLSVVIEIDISTKGEVKEGYCKEFIFGGGLGFYICGFR